MLERNRRDFSFNSLPMPTISRLKLLAHFFIDRIVDALLRYGFKTSARRILSWQIVRRSPDRKMLSRISRAWKGLTSNKRITDARAEHLKYLIQKPIAQKNFPRILSIMARFEDIGRNPPVAAGDQIARQLVSEIGRNRILAATKVAMRSEPDSPFLLYLLTMTMSKSGDYIEASKMLGERIEQLSKKVSTTDLEMKQNKKRFEMLRNAWRVVDAIAREDTGWLDDDRGGSYASLVSVDDQRREGGTTQNWLLNFKEPYLQSRNERAYLDICLSEFNAGATLIIKLKAIKEILRQGVRRQLTYRPAFDLASKCFEELKEARDALVNSTENDFRTAKDATIAVQTIGLALDICQELELTDELLRYKGILAEWAEWDGFASAKWLILPILVTGDLDTWRPVAQSIRDSLSDVPSNEQQVKSFFQWAMIVREFEDADEVFAELTPNLKASAGALYYVNILQRQSRFTEAVKCIMRAHAYMLAKPRQLNPFQHLGLLRRYGEMKFLRDTAKYYQQFPQPRKPKGVLVIGPRNIDQLRKYPIVVLMEMKKRGWAVVPLVEGLLPREMTGDVGIDNLHGCLTIELAFRPNVEHVFPQLEDFVADPERGVLRWGAIDLSHSLLEDARISRRAYNVDLTCPVLVKNSRRLSLWTEHFARTMEYARDRFAIQGPRIAWMSLFNSRLPDSLFRFYCDEYGDPERFFCLHTANGYENYFRNFKSSISTRCVIRNVTKYKHVRASSMPVPELFEEFYQSNLDHMHDILEQVEDAVKVRRTTGGSGEIDPQALACEEKIMKWREAGGKVVCLFGRVVCDSAVPFDGGPVHKDLVDWLHHSIEAVRGSNTLLLIKPHPHELNEQIATYLNEYFIDLIKVDLPENVIVLGHRWFDIQSLKRFVDLGTLYNGTTAVELALMEIPAVLCGHFGPIDYPVGHMIPKTRHQYEDMLTFKSAAKADPDMRMRAAMWLQYMSKSSLILDYRYHTRPITNKVIYPPEWIAEDIDRYRLHGDDNVQLLAKRAIGQFDEPRL